MQRRTRLTQQQEVELRNLRETADGKPGIFEISDTGDHIWALFIEKPQHSGEVMLTPGTLEALSEAGYITLKSTVFTLRR